MSNLSELNGFAASVPDVSQALFPVIPIPGIPGNKVDYLGKVTTENKWWDLRFPKKRTTEHFMTVDFYREGKSVKIKIRAWDARNPDKKTGLPKAIRDFDISPITLK